MKFRAQILFCLVGLLTAVPAAQAHFFSGLFSWFYKKPVAVSASSVIIEQKDLRAQLSAAVAAQQETLRQAREAVKVIVARRNREMDATDRRLDTLNMQWRDAQIEIAELRARVAQNSSSSKVRLDWRELLEAEDDAPELQRGDKGCWWEPAINRRRWWE